MKKSVLGLILGFIFVFHERTQELSLIPRNIEFECENPTNKDIDIIYE